MLTRAAAAALACFIAASAEAQTAPMPTVNTPAHTQPTISALDLRRMLAPIALYPDPILVNILAASTYPAQIVEAQRFLSDPVQARLSVPQLTAAAATHDWDPSVTALLAYPEVLQMLDADLEWTEHLGRVFIAQQADVLNAVQALRLLAQQTGALTSGPYDSVVNDGEDIEILPPSEQNVYLPAYNPACVYGPEPACAPDQEQVSWLADDLLPFGYLQWGSLDWRRRNIRFNDGLRTGGPVWRHTGLTQTGRVVHYAPPASQPYSARQTYRPGYRAASPAVPLSATPAHRALSQMARAPSAVSHSTGIARR